MQNSDSCVKQKNESIWLKILLENVWIEQLDFLVVAYAAPHMLSVFLSRDLSMNNISQLPPSPLHTLRFLEEL